jgi:opacity protein-like surface antigen
MKRIALVVVLSLCVVAAQAQVKFGAGAQVGMSFASAPEPLDKVYGFGFGFGAHGDVSFSKNFAARVNFDYHIFSADQDELAKRFQGATFQGQPLTSIQTEGAGISFISVTVNGIGKLPLGGSVTPYAIVGLGYGNTSSSDLTIRATAGGQGIEGNIDGSSDGGFLLNFGAGAEFSISKVVTLYGEIKYVLLMISEETDPQTGQKSGGNSSQLPIMFGATYWF